MMISPGGFFIFLILIFWAVLGKKVKIAKNEKIITSITHHISGTV